MFRDFCNNNVTFYGRPALELLVLRIDAPVAGEPVRQILSDSLVNDW